MGGPQGRSGRVRKISPLTGIDPRTVQPLASRYTDWVVPKYTRLCIWYETCVFGGLPAGLYPRDQQGSVHAESSLQFQCIWNIWNYLLRGPSPPSSIRNINTAFFWTVSVPILGPYFFEFALYIGYTGSLFFSVIYRLSLPAAVP
jgi:hypothetical protein